MRMHTKWYSDYRLNRQKSLRILNISRRTNRQLTFMGWFTPGIYRQKMAWKKCLKSLKQKNSGFVQEFSVIIPILKMIKRWKYCKLCCQWVWVMSLTFQKSRSIVLGVKTYTCPRDRGRPSQPGAEVVKSTLMELILAQVFPISFCLTTKTCLKQLLKSHNLRMTPALRSNDI